MQLQIPAPFPTGNLKASLPPPYTMPEAKIGQVVYWYASRGYKEAQPALVVSVGHDTVDLLIMVSDSAAFLPRGGVRHICDPAKQKIDNGDVGCWDFSDEHKALCMLAEHVEQQGGTILILLEAVEKLRQRVEALTNTVGPITVEILQHGQLPEPGADTSHLSPQLRELVDQVNAGNQVLDEEPKPAGDITEILAQANVGPTSGPAEPAETIVENPGDGQISYGDSVRERAKRKQKR